MPLVRGYLEFIDQPSPPGGGLPPHVWHPEFPTNPIVVPPGGAYPGAPSGPPLHPSHPIVNYPSHPIVLPPGEQPPEPGNGLTPTHPIVIPPSTPGEGGSQKALVYAIVPGVGGVWFLIEVPVQPPPTEAQPKG